MIRRLKHQDQIHFFASPQPTSLPFNTQSAVRMSIPYTIQHFTHYHPLTQANAAGTYTCDGCKLYGEGKTYRCNDCDYDLHEYCATCPPSLINSCHGPDHELSLFNGPTTERPCYICRVYIQGMFYTCRHCSFESHPLCSHVPMHASSPDASVTKQRSLHDPARQSSPSPPHHYVQGNPYGYAYMGQHGAYPSGGGHQIQNHHPYMNSGSPKAVSNPSSSTPEKEKKKKKPGFFETMKAAASVTMTVAAQMAVASIVEGE